MGADLTEPELCQEILKLRRRVQKLAALCRLVLALLQASGFTLSRKRLPDGRAKRRLLRAIDQARACIPLRALLQFLGLSPSRFHAWRQQGRPRARSTISRPVRARRRINRRQPRPGRSRPW
jgi:hypothetical protein